MTELDDGASTRIVRAVRQFEEAWRAGTPPMLERLLDAEADDRGRAELFRLALPVELSFRRGRGDSPGPAEYARRFPDHLAAIGEAFAQETLTWIPDGPTAVMPPEAPSPPVKGRADGRLGKYEVVGRLGGGGQGAAILARDPDVGRLVVVKRYHRAGDDAANEARALARVQSPYTARCLELMRHDGQHFLVMEYIPGRSLSDVLEKAPPTPREAARLAEHVAEGLEAVHACGLVHRDLKPSNVVVGDDGLARLVDFGLAAHLGSEALQCLSGTPPYMSPEQARGQWERIDPRSDIYGLGGVLYALLTGRPPHPGRTQAEILEHAREGVVTPPRDLKPRRPVPRDLERVVMKALEPDPSRRHASAADLRRALRRYRHRPALRATLAGLVAAAALGLTAVVLAAWLPARPEPARKPALAESATATSTTPTLAPALAPLTGELIVRVYAPTKPGLGVDEPGALPLVAGEQVQLEARLSRPGYVYLLWIDNEGHVTQLYPRADGLYGSRPGVEAPRDSVRSPDANDQGIEMSGPGGLETALLLARRDPLPTGTDLPTLIGRLPRSPFGDEREVAVLEFDQARRSATVRKEQNRGIGSGKVKTIDDPILHLMERLRARENFEVIKAMRVAYSGEPAAGPPPVPGRH